MKVYYIKDSIGNLIDIDENSGGYPIVRPDSIPRFWIREKDANELLTRYIDMKLLSPLCFVVSVEL